jgi:CDP-diacylglycerol--glycerol-3-phosphate 3-phosphatidyltransferase
VIDTHLWGTVLILAAAVLTIWSMVYYLRKAVPDPRQGALTESSRGARAGST